MDGMSRLTDEDIDRITRDKWGSQLLGAMVQAHRECARAVEAAVIERLRGEPVLWQYRWTNPGGYPNITPEELEWQEVKPWNHRIQTIEQRVEELRAFTYNGKPAYEVRALYDASPQP